MTDAGTKHSSATAWLAHRSSLQMIQRMLRHADSRSTERYAKLGNLALVDVIRPRNRPSRSRNGSGVDPVLFGHAAGKRRVGSEPQELVDRGPGQAERLAIVDRVLEPSGGRTVEVGGGVDRKPRSRGPPLAAAKAQTYARGC